MKIDRKKLEEEISIFLDNLKKTYLMDKDGPNYIFFHQAFFNIRNPDLHKSKRILGLINLNLWRIENAIFLLDWYRKVRFPDKVDLTSWFDLAHIILERFFIKIRTILDNISNFLRELVQLSVKKEEIKLIQLRKFNSINDLYKWITGIGGENTKKISIDQTNIIGKDIVNLITKIGWFKEIKIVRDELVHQKTITYGILPNWSKIQLGDMTKDGIFFSVDLNSESLEKLPYFLYKKRRGVWSFNFETFSAYYYMKLSLFLEDFATLIMNRYKMPKFLAGFQKPINYSLIETWSKKILEKL